MTRGDHDRHGQIMEIAGNSLREAATEETLMPIQLVHLGPMGEWDYLMNLAQMAEEYHFEDATLDVQGFHGIRELRSSLSDY